jgi:carboxyl-terminal processing protease
MNRLTKQIVLALSILVMAYVAAGFVLQRSSEDKTYRSLTVYSEVLEHVQKDYVEDPDMHSVTVGALHGLLDSLDPNSSYLSPLEYKDYVDKTRRKVDANAGMAISKRNGYVIVISVLPDSPAQKAGLHAGDYLESIGGFTTSQMSIGQAQVLLTGQPGTSVKLSVIRRTRVEPEDVEVVLAKPIEPKIVEDRLEGDIAYLRLTQLDAASVGKLRDKLVELASKNVNKLIVDVRDCAVGFPEDGVVAAQLFIPSGTIATLKGQTIAAQTFSADASKVVWKAPVVLLVSSGTAGAGEVLAGAVGDDHRGETVGDRTFGAASTQKVIQLDDGSALILTVGEYFTPGGKSIPVDGVVPTVPATSEDLATLNDQQQLSAPPPGQAASPDDPLVKKAITILQGGTVNKKAA